MTDKEQQEREFINLWQITHPAFNPSGIDVEKAEAIVRRKMERRGSIVRKALLYWQRMAAVLLLPLVGLSFYLYLDNRKAAYQGDEYQVLKSPYGTCSRVSLPDGSNVWLNGGTELRYPLKFKPGKRLVQLNGEAYFEVSSDRGNPFVVQTAQMNLTATGTRFNVEAYAGRTLTAVTMVEGKVSAAFGKLSSLSLLPDTRACYDSQTGQRTLEQANPYKWYAWKDGLMIFRNDSLGYVFSRLEQTFNVSIILKDPSLSDAAYRATFEDESLDEILRLLEMTAPIRFVYQKRSKTTDGPYEKQIIEVYRNKKSP